MEGKAVLFKRFADIDVFDLEIDSEDPEDVIRVCKLLEPTFGGINLEDIKAPECFYIEQTLRRELSIPVFHDDQHGTAVISGAGLLNALELTGRDITSTRVVVNGAGAAAIACARFYRSLGIAKQNLILCDSRGVIFEGRESGMNSFKQEFAIDTPSRTLPQALEGADVLLGLSKAGVVSGTMVRSMADKPIVLALANPDPEISWEEAKAARPDVIMATGRSDYPNQVNNVLGFPFIFRGALDVQASGINEDMKIAATRALADLAKEDVPADVSEAYGNIPLAFGPEYILPKPLDSRVLLRAAPAVAEAAMKSGLAHRQIDLQAYLGMLEARMR